MNRVTAQFFVGSFPALDQALSQTDVQFDLALTPLPVARKSGLQFQILKKRWNPHTHIQAAMAYPEGTIHCEISLFSGIFFQNS